MQQCKYGSYLQIDNYVTEAVCKNWTEIILSKKSEWSDRKHGSSFGNVWYLDIEDGAAAFYFANAKNSNKLVNTLPSYVSTMIGAAKYLQPPTKYKKDEVKVRSRGKNLGNYWCKTGLHIFGGEGYSLNKKHNIGVRHLDLEGLIPYPETMFKKSTRAYSVVLSVACPKRGGGLDVWSDRRYYASTKFDEPNESSLVRLAYKPGSLTIIDSFLFHKIQPIVVSKDHPYRITGVIHFLFRESPEPHWEYWF